MTLHSCAKFIQMIKNICQICQILHTTHRLQAAMCNQTLRWSRISYTQASTLPCNNHWTSTCFTPCSLFLTQRCENVTFHRSSQSLRTKSSNTGTRSANKVLSRRPSRCKKQCSTITFKFLSCTPHSFKAFDASDHGCMENYPIFPNWLKKKAKFIFFKYR